MPSFDLESLTVSAPQHEHADGGRGRVAEVVIVDASCDRYADFVRAAQAGELGLHFCVDGRSAVRLARRFRADAWLVAADLPDMPGLDLVDMLVPPVLRGSVAPLHPGARVAPDHDREGLHAGIFIVADAYRLEDEQRALAAGVAGFLVHPVSLDTLRRSRPHVSVPA